MKTNTFLMAMVLFTGCDGLQRNLNCEQICRTKEKCELTEDRDSCIETCNEDTRRDVVYFERFTICAIGNCELFDDPAEVSACDQESVAAVGISSAASDYCRVAFEKAEDCDEDEFTPGPFSLGECAELLSPLSAALLVDTKACFDRDAACSGISDCVEEAQKRYLGSGGTFP